MTHNYKKALEVFKDTMREGDYTLAVQSALSKQIPKKPSETDKARCIHCACVVKRSEKFCKNCGQALEWGDK
jgi:hypothetical protein